MRRRETLTSICARCHVEPPDLFVYFQTSVWLILVSLVWLVLVAAVLGLLLGMVLAALLHWRTRRPHS